MYVAYVPMKNGHPQEPKVEWCETCEACLYIHEHIIGVYATRELASQVAQEYWLYHDLFSNNWLQKYEK